MFKQSPYGFTIIEVIAATFVLVIGVVGVFALVNQSLSISNMLSSRLTAVYLAQEGLELMRNVRDYHWLIDDNWNGGTAADCGIDYTMVESATPCDPALASTYLTLDSNGFYSYYIGGKQTNFKRTISSVKTVLTKPWDKLEITVTVSWDERGQTNKFVAKEILYNWR